MFSTRRRGRRIDEVPNGKNERTIEFAVSKLDKYVRDESRAEAIDCMIEITRCIIKLLEGWIWTKNNEDKLPELKKKTET